jgi:hypothetical protein
MPDGAAKTLYQGWVDTSRMPTPTMTVPVRLRDCDERSMTCMAWIDGHVEIYFPDLADLAGPQYDGRDLELARGTFLHELGHVVDWSRRHPGTHRERIMRLLDLEGGWWSWRYEDVPPGETFGDAFSYCAQGRSPQESRYEGYRAYHPSPRVHRKVCALIEEMS